jgi:hypothetical protein
MSWNSPPSKKVVERLLDMYWDRADRRKRTGYHLLYMYWHGKFQALEMMYERITLL